MKMQHPSCITFSNYSLKNPCWAAQYLRIDHGYEIQFRWHLSNQVVLSPQYQALSARRPASDVASKRLAPCSKQRLKLDGPPDQSVPPRKLAPS